MLEVNEWTLTMFFLVDRVIEKKQWQEAPYSQICLLRI